MTRQETSPHFFKVILDHTLQHGSLRLPPAFVKNHGHSLSNFAHLRVPDARIWKMELKRERAKVWLDKGWRGFAEYYSIKPGYFLMFKYDGGSFFHVFIFNFTSCEINYSPDKSAVKHKIDGVASVYKGRFLQKGGLFKSENPHFIIYISPYYAFSKGYVHIPMSHYKRFMNDGENEMLVRGSNGEIWQMLYDWIPGQRRGMIKNGWKQFVEENHLKVGDACAFELIDKNTQEYGVTIFRV